MRASKVSRRVWHDESYHVIAKLCIRQTIRRFSSTTFEWCSAREDSTRHGYKDLYHEDERLWTIDFNQSDFDGDKNAEALVE
ncbi:unnamed protein product [Angiostrongylus costaricensis]|uniref:Integrase n=1 Tax=Angiostrongylus costaricensis TaxID=334426 RepID=A0A0R3PQK8_ANGCS|nr:unnamed protein product [Angiostrongylus costaricensis]